MELTKLQESRIKRNLNQSTSVLFPQFRNIIKQALKNVKLSTKAKEWLDDLEDNGEGIAFINYAEAKEAISLSIPVYCHDHDDEEITINTEDKLEMCSMKLDDTGNGFWVSLAYRNR